jgi:periplasmic divalent cation tolerance protein
MPKIAAPARGSPYTGRMATDVLVVLCTLPDADTAAEVGGALVKERLAACVNVIPQLRSIYEWEGKICDDPEVLAVIKTTRDRFEEMRARLVELHPYECPEVLGLPVEHGHADYLSWVAQVVR